MPDKSPTLADDLLVGAGEIAAYTGRTKRQIFHIARQGYWPIFKSGPFLTARKSELNSDISAKTAKAR
jgi:hypothetical protein